VKGKKFAEKEQARVWMLFCDKGRSPPVLGKGGGVPLRDPALLLFSVSVNKTKRRCQKDLHHHLETVKKEGELPQHLRENKAAFISDGKLFYHGKYPRVSWDPRGGRRKEKVGLA